MSKIITPQQWFQADIKLPTFYNDTGALVSIVQENAKEEVEVMVYPGHILQVNCEQAFLARIDLFGKVKYYILAHHPLKDFQNEFFDPEGLLACLRTELYEVVILPIN